MNKTELEALEEKGVIRVLDEISQGGHGSPGSATRLEVEAWLQRKKVEADNLKSSKRDAREEATLAIAKEANSIAREEASSANRAATAAERQAVAAERSARLAKIAAIVAAIAAVISAAIPIVTK